MPSWDRRGEGVSRVCMRLGLRLLERRGEMEGSWVCLCQETRWAWGQGASVVAGSLGWPLLGSASAMPSPRHLTLEAGLCPVPTHSHAPQLGLRSFSHLAAPSEARSHQFRDPSRSPLLPTIPRAVSLAPSTLPEGSSPEPGCTWPRATEGCASQSGPGLCPWYCASIQSRSSISSCSPSGVAEPRVQGESQLPRAGRWLEPRHYPVGLCDAS